MAHFGILATFDHNSQCWQTYKNRLSQWFIANNIGRAEDPQCIKRRAILLSALSDGSYKLAADLALPKEVQDLPFEDIIKLFDDHFTPKTCGFSERFTFYVATQKLGESYTQWAARLRGLTAHCGFLNVEEALRDRFVMGMLPGPEREKLFAQDVKALTLSKALELAVSVHCARQGAASSAASHAPNDQALFKISQQQDRVKSASDKKIQCSVCGYKNHTASVCRFASYKCKKCNTKGHLQRMCKKVNYLDNAVVNESEDDDGRSTLYNIRSFSGEPMAEMVNVQGVKMKFQIDSGSAVTAISDKIYQLKFQNVPLKSTNKRLLSYTGEKISCLGIIRLAFTYNNVTNSLDVYVVKHGGPPILGRDFISRFKLALLPINFLSTDDLLEQLQSRYPFVFSDSLGKFNKYKVTLQLTENSKPIFFKPRPVAFALKSKIDAEIDRLISIGVLKPVQHAAYASPIVPVLKRNGSIRLCADYSVSINKQLLVEQYPLPTAQELFSRLHGGTEFSKLDLTQAYSQFVLDEDSQQLTCINTHRGLFKYTRLVFGLASAPAIFQRAMDCLLSGLDGVVCMLDDILITGINRVQHLERLNAVLKRLQDAGLTLQKSKCELFKDKVEYLGYTIDKCGLHKSPQKVKAILEAPIPSNINQLQSFLGLVNYYRNFVPNASTILCPLYKLLHKGHKWEWGKEQNDAFNLIKKCLSSDHVLAHFNPKAKVVLTVDASPHGLGAILSQIGDDETERPVSFASRTLNSAEKKYSQIQKEATAIIFGVRRFHQYLYGRSVPFVLRTDHKPLLSIFGPQRGIPEVSANRLQRYAMFLSGYNYTIEYISSSNNSADYLSRASLPELAQAAARARAERDGAPDDVIDDRASYVCFVTDGTLPVTLRDMRELTSKDRVLCKVVNYILNGWPPKVSDPVLKPYYLCRTQLSYENGCIMRGHKVVIPEALRHKILVELHKSHLGVVKSKAEARARLWFPGIDNAIENMISNCEVCIQLRPLPGRAPLAVWPHPKRPFHRIHIDFLGPINNLTYLIVVDAHSKWVEAYYMKCTSSSSVVSKLMEFISRFGLPQTLVSDNGTAFTSQEFKAFCISNGISHVTSPAYHPASNGQAESYVKVIKRGIKSCIIENNKKDLNAKILKYLFDYRNSIHSTTGFSPAQLVFGRKLRSRLDLINPLTAPPSSDALANNVKNNQCLQSKSYGGKNKQYFSEGDIVLYKTYNIKFHPWNKGIVIKKIGKVTYLVKDCITSLTCKKHKNQLTLYRGTANSNQQLLAKDCVIELDDFTKSQSMSPNSITEPMNVGQVPIPQRSQDEEEEEFYEAVELEGESGAGLESVSQSSEPPLPNARSRAAGRLLRPVPQVDYKQFFCLDV
ncbi:uncharacterized protein K02A2.6-like isoform X2 [Ostrinia furnacalis]|uniref:uncharacterized protein K02A2.6-like isoform X1 n=1 Tax=Ostrinia furnacalis TaxID=93504 RepID=UPI00103E18D8|nr:uncharacterized protein K02A2.6-like isoform X1 [Ostrinia furnacalis]XP_028164568.1 uncharacterized protein K02A2.6-like isoform X2 [Ostrinia furnacalis]